MVRFEDEKTKKTPFDQNEFRNELSVRGDSLLVVSDEEVVKVHVHTEYPGEAMTLGQQYGSLINMDIEKMREPHTYIVGEQAKKSATGEKTDYAIVTVAMESGLQALYERLGATVVSA